MTRMTVAAMFTQNAGEPATGLTLTDIGLYLTRIRRADGVETVIWNGSQNPSAEVQDIGAYIRAYDADFTQYDYYGRGTYNGGVILDVDHVTGVIGPLPAIASPGAIQFVYTLTNSLDGSPIADADVWVTSDIGGAFTLDRGRTDQNGKVTFYLDAGTVYVWRQKTGFNFVNPDVEVVNV